MRRHDAPSVPQLAVPVTVIQHCQKIRTSTKSKADRHACDLITVAFYYLLRVGEYTKPRKVKQQGQWVPATRTRQFAVGDVGFFKDGNIMSKHSTLKELLQATSATLKISNQKNGKMGQTIHHESAPCHYCPIQALARIIHHILSNGGTNETLICEFHNGTSFDCIKSEHIVKMVRKAVTALQLHRNGINPALVGSHSLRAGGAMALKLHGESDTTIMKYGRWSGLTFMQYIHNQIAHISKDISTKMSTPLPFVNIADISEPTA